MHLDNEDPDYEHEYNVLIIHISLSTEGCWLCIERYTYNNNK